jgi:signal transduction histidine kinase
MRPPPRVLWLPALAVVLPFCFAAVLGYTWLGVEREAANQRGARTADAAAGALRQDLERDLRTVAEQVASADETSHATPLAPPTSCSDLCSQAFVFNPSGGALWLDPEAPPAALVDARREASDSADQVAASIEGTVPRTPPSAALAALGAADIHRRAAALLALARHAVTAGRSDDAHVYARAISQCCATERDEFSTAYVLYAADIEMRLAAAHSDGGTSQLTDLAGDLRALVDRGFLGTDIDVSTVRAFGSLAPQVHAFDALLQQIAAIHAQLEERLALSRALSSVVAQIDRTTLLQRVVVRRIDEGPTSTTVALLASMSGPLVAMVLDPNHLEAWVARWARAHGPFDVALRGGPSQAAPSEVRVPLFPDTAGLTLAVQPRASFLPLESSRQRLFAFAVVGVLALTLGIAVMAGRDVLREVRTASLRAGLVASLTHELKTPLASIRLQAETLRQGRAGPETQDELLDTIIDDTERLGRLVDNALSSARIESGTRDYHPQVLSLPDVVQRAVRRFDHILKSEGFRLVARLDAGALLVRADPEALDQAVLNLLGNAVKYSGSSRDICVAVATQNGEVTLSVSDKGIGIAPAEQSRVFDPFYRAPRAAAEAAGAGLGLALVKHFADAHGGRVALTSAPGAGSVFSLSLPLIEDVPTHG